jgi:hypothetical protein
MLTVVACNQYVSPASTAQAQGPFGGISMSSMPGALDFLDTRTGDVWLYDRQRDGKPFRHWRITKLGQPLVKAE